ncbi:MAG TPA: addiction module protein [Thermoanaerobaculia bacterium]|jgi:putative addiction module component (TIGR02574 family)|nr:addiction module protein [Thermoanaerobaculia bacterium]
MASQAQRDVSELLLQALQLEPLARAALAKALLASLDDLSDEDYEQLWAEEAEARYADFEAGRTTAVDGDEVFARARARAR